MSELFRVMGSISVDTREFMTAMDNAIQRATQLSDTINGINGMTANVNINQTGAAVPAGNAAGGNGNAAQAANANADHGDDDGGGAGGVMVVGAGQDGWNIGRGVVAQWLANAGQWLFEQTVDWLGTGWDRNKNEEVVTAQYMTLMGGSRTDAIRMVDEIIGFAQDTPLNVEDSLDIGARLLSYGIFPDELIDTMWWMGDITQGDSARMMSFAKGYTEALGKGGLYAQEANQMINAGVPVYSILEDYYASDEYTGENKGLTSTEIKGRLNANSHPVTVSSDDLSAAFEYATSESGRYHNMMADMMNTQFGQEQVLGDNMTNIAAGITDPIQDLWSDTVLPGLVDFTGFIEGIFNPPRTVVDDLVDEGVLPKPSISTIPDKPLAGSLLRITNNTGPKDPLEGNVIDTFMGEGTLDYIMQPANNMFSNLAEHPIHKNIKTFFKDWGNLLWHTGGKFAFEHLGGKYISGLAAGLWNLPGMTSSDDYWERVEAAMGDRDLPLPVESLRLRRHNTPQQRYPMGAPPDVDTIIFDDGRPHLPPTPGYSSMLVQLQNMPQQITAAVQEGMNGVTITANVITGDVRLQDGTIVGALTPKINLLLGAMNASSSRG